MQEILTCQREKKEAMQSNAADSLFRTKMNTSPPTHSHHVDKMEPQTECPQFSWTLLGLHPTASQSPITSNDIQSLYDYICTTL
jgi:hypothetical protein